MLEIQKYLLSGGSFCDLNEKLGIKPCYHPELPLVILNYDQIESPKLDPFVREARGLVLNSNDFSLVARSFPRFFNWGEVPEEMDQFDFTDFTVQSKEDGSLALLYYFENNWHLNTRGSFALDPLQDFSFTWREAMCKALQIDSLSQLNEKLDKKITYICEFVSPWNKIVRKYIEPKMYLLTAFCGHEEICYKKLQDYHLNFFDTPVNYYFKGIKEIQQFLTKQSENDPTFEGVVIRDKNNNRWKIKNPSYLSLHKIRGEGNNIFSYKNLLPYVLENNGDELLSYFPEVGDNFNCLKDIIEDHFKLLLSIWNKNKHIESQKNFALAIKGTTPYTSVLFSLRKKYGHEPCERELRTEFVAAEHLILKNLPKPTLDQGFSSEVTGPKPLGGKS